MLLFFFFLFINYYIIFIFENLQKKQLIMNKKILNNINLTISTLKHCLSILDKTNKINIQIENHKYYSALRV